MLAAFNPTDLDIRHLTLVALLYQVCACPLDFMLIVFSSFNTALFFGSLPPLPYREGSPSLSHYIPNEILLVTFLKLSEGKESLSNGLPASIHIEFIFSDPG